MANNPVGWFEIYVDNMERAVAFYQTVLATEFQPLGDPTGDSATMMLFPSNMESYGSSGALIHFDEVKAGNNSTVVYFSCEDCAVEESRVEDAGGSVHRPKMQIGEHGFVSLIVDTEGNMFGLHSLK